MHRSARRAWLPGLLVLLVGCIPPAAISPSAGAASVAASASASASSGALAESTASPSASATAAPSDPGGGPETGSTYTVQRGDTLTAIGRAHGTTSAQLQAWNVDRYPSLAAQPGVIEPGWELVVSGDPGVAPRPRPSVAPTPRPSTPPPAASACTAGDRVAAGASQTFRTIPSAGSGVALTFDMGGRMDPAVDIMNFLVANEVCATIFATGVMSQTPQGQQVMTIIRAHPELFEIANHTMYHCDLVRGGGGSPSTGPCTGGSFSAERIRRELTEAEAILRAGTGQTPQPYWRPPYGSVNQAVLDAAASAGYTKTLLWDIDTIDWKPIADGGPSAEQIATRVIGGAVNGSNVLFHLGGYETLDALRLIVPALRDRGFTVTSLSDLLN